MTNCRHLIAEITAMFFRSKEFKIFDVTNGGYFVSLGLTTSFETLEKLKNVFNGSDYGFNANIVELRSKRLDDLTYENVITSKKAEKYKSVVPKGATILRSEARNDYPEISKSIESWEGGWETHGILLIPGRVPVVYYDLVNYKKQPDGSELRIGIYVAENN